MDAITLEKLHETELKILDEIVRICENNGITYYLAGGSVLGAIRHKGIIPWDDDIDVMMPRADFDKFAKACEKELSSEYFYQSSETDPHYHHIFAKVRKNNTEFIEAGVQDIGQHNGIFVDIFPLDNARAQQGKQTKRAMWANKMEFLMRVKDKETKGRFFDRILVKFISFKSLRKMQKRFMTADNKKDCEFYVNYGSQYGVKKQTMPKSIYAPPVKVEFEGRSCCVPKEYDEFLKRLYGENYMQLPPEEKRVTHNPIKISF